jgi:hypothetical protein
VPPCSTHSATPPLEIKRHCTDDKPVTHASEPAWKEPAGPTHTTPPKSYTDLNNNIYTPEQCPQDSVTNRENPDFNEIIAETVSSQGVKRMRLIKTPYKDIANCINIPESTSPTLNIPPATMLNTPNIFEEIEKMRVENDNLIALAPSTHQNDGVSNFMRELEDIPALATTEECYPDNIIQLTTENVTVNQAQPWEAWSQTINPQNENPHEMNTPQEPQVTIQEQPTETDPLWQDKPHQYVTFGPQQVFKTSMWYHIDHSGLLTSIMDETYSAQGEVQIEVKTGKQTDQNTQTIEQKLINQGVQAVEMTREVGVGHIYSSTDMGCQTCPDTCGSSTQTAKISTTDRGTQCHPERSDGSTNTPSRVQIPMTITMELLGNNDTKFRWCHDE